MDGNARNQTEAEQVSSLLNVPYRVAYTTVQMRVRAAVHAYTLYVFTVNFHADSRRVEAIIQTFNSIQRQSEGILEFHSSSTVKNTNSHSFFHSFEGP